MRNGRAHSSKDAAIQARRRGSMGGGNALRAWSGAVQSAQGAWRVTRRRRASRWASRPQRDVRAVLNCMG